MKKIVTLYEMLSNNIILGSDPEAGSFNEMLANILGAISNDNVATNRKGSKQYLLDIIYKVFHELGYMDLVWGKFVSTFMPSSIFDVGKPTRDSPRCKRTLAGLRELIREIIDKQLPKIISVADEDTRELQGNNIAYVLDKVINVVLEQGLAVLPKLEDALVRAVKRMPQEALRNLYPTMWKKQKLKVTEKLALKIGTSKSPKWLKNLIAEKVKPAIVKELEKKIPKFMEKIIPQQEYLEPFIDDHVHTPLNSVVKRTGNAVANGIGYVGSAVGSGLGYVAGGLWSATKFTANLPLQVAKLPFQLAYKLGAAVGLVGSDPDDESSSDGSSSREESSSTCSSASTDTEDEDYSRYAKRRLHRAQSAYSDGRFVASPDSGSTYASSAA